MHNIFIVGAAKAGTTTLYQLLSQHPEVCSPIVKEPGYFSNLEVQDVVKPGVGPGDNSTVWTKTLEEYHSLYRISSLHKFKLDASVSYFYSSCAARYIAEYSPDANIIIILRNPVDRAWSHYKHLIRDGREKFSFEEALEREDERIQKGWEFSWHLKHMGLYSQQIQRYLDHFDKNRIHFLLFEDLIRDTAQVVKSTSDFLRLSDVDYLFKQERDNKSGLSRSKNLARFVNWVAGYKTEINRIIAPSVTHYFIQRFRTVNVKEGGLSLSKATREQLTSYFMEDILKTEHLTGHDLSAWKN